MNNNTVAEIKEQLGGNNELAHARAMDTLIEELDFERDSDPVHYGFVHPLTSILLDRSSPMENRQKALVALGEIASTNSSDEDVLFALKPILLALKKSLPIQGAASKALITAGFSKTAVTHLFNVTSKDKAVAQKALDGLKRTKTVLAVCSLLLLFDKLPKHLQIPILEFADDVSRSKEHSSGRPNDKLVVSLSFLLESSATMSPEIQSKIRNLVESIVDTAELCHAQLSTFSDLEVTIDLGITWMQEKPTKRDNSLHVDGLTTLLERVRKKAQATRELVRDIKKIGEKPRHSRRSKRTVR